MDGKREARGSFSDSRGRDSRSQRDYMQRDPGGQDQSRPTTTTTTTPSKGYCTGGTGCSSWRRQKKTQTKRSRELFPKETRQQWSEEVLLVWPSGAREEELSYSKAKQGWRWEDDGTGSCSCFLSSSSSPSCKGSSDYKMAERVKELELWRENLNQTRKRRSDQPTELERATKVVLSSLGREKPFDPFE